MISAFVKTILSRYRRPLIVAVHLPFIVTAYYLAFWIRFDGAIPAHAEETWFAYLPSVVVVQMLTFAMLGLYRGLWRYSSIGDLQKIILGATAGVMASYVLGSLFLGIWFLPIGIVTIQILMLIFLLGGVRLVRRAWYALDYRENIGSLRHPNGNGYRQPGRRVLVFGAGDAGEMIVRDMKNNPFYACVPIGFVDDDSVKTGQRIHNIPVLGNRRDLDKIIHQHRPDEVLIAIPGADPHEIREVIKSLEPYNLPIKTLPNLRDILTGKVTVETIRNVELEDLLPRQAVGLDIGPISELLSGRRVMVTGAGGSIGSELCRQILALKPSLLLAFERHENSLFTVSHSLSANDSGGAVELIVGDVTDVHRVNEVMDRYRPEIVFHAAAHKHVPLMEFNASEAVKNNVGGTRVLAEAAVRSGVKRFIFISSDKAVKPTSVMGATKRVGEMMIRSIAKSDGRLFAAVRFGNVLGSNGSVVPLFREQIRSGGPVTVTHPEMRRYFMLIPEAVQLVLHAATMSDPGAIYVLEMGEQIRISELARTLIQLSGYVPDRDIAIEYIGLRPGEKLFEELLEDDELVEPSSVQQVLRLQDRANLDRKWLARQISQVEASAARGDDKSSIRGLRALVPSFQVPGFQGDQPEPAAYRESV